jgi:lambda family phage portal protein
MATSALVDQYGKPIVHAERQVQTRRQGDIRARFDAAQVTDENSRHWVNADYLGPNGALNPAVRKRLVSRARYEWENNTYCRGMIRTLANDLIGTGPSLQVIDATREEAVAIENAVWKWFQAARIPEKLRTMRQAKARDGETFAEFRTNPRIKSPVRLDLIPFETDLVEGDHTGYPNSSLLDGLYLDDFGNVIAYRVLNQHPGDGGLFWFTGESEILKADNVLHLFNADRPGQLRGCPEITPALPLYAQLRKYTLAVIRAAESAAIPSWIIETQGDAVSDPEAFDTVETERGMGLTLPKGSKMSQLKAEHPTSTYGAFKREIVAEIARCLGMPYNVAAGDSSSYNYSSGRLDHRTYYKALRVERSYWEIGALDVILAKWWEEASLIPGLLPRRFFRSEVPAHEWRWDGDEHVDPTKEADAMVTRIAYGFTDISAECASLGGDASVIHQKNADILGLTIDEYRKRLADKFFGATVASMSQPVSEEPPSNPYNGGFDG